MQGTLEKIRAVSPNSQILFIHHCGSKQKKIIESLDEKANKIQINRIEANEPSEH